MGWTLLQGRFAMLPQFPQHHPGEKQTNLGLPARQQDAQLVDGWAHLKPDRVMSLRRSRVVPSVLIGELMVDSNR